MTTATEVAAAVEAARRRIAAAAARVERDPSTVRIVAVTKTFGPEAVAAAVDAGITDIGENRVQEAATKREAVTAGARLHLLGHLQSNKAARAAQLFDVVHSVDDEATALALSAHRAYDADPIAVLIQVDYTGGATRSGVTEDAAFTLARGLAGVGGIHLTGFMTIAPPDDPGAARDAFRHLRGLRDTIEFRLGWELPELSMGMSDDFEIAVEEGATMVRLGRALFGRRGA